MLSLLLAAAAVAGAGEPPAEKLKDLELPALAAEAASRPAEVTCAPGSPVDGASDGPLSGALRRLLDKPRTLRSLLDNRLIVAVFMSTDRALCNCADPAALHAYLSNPEGPIKEMLPTVELVLQRPATADAVLGSLLASKLLGCRGIRSLARDSAALGQLRRANPLAFGLIDDPRVERALAASPDALRLLAAARANAPH